MTIECYKTDCEYHGSKLYEENGPLCYEVECKNPSVLAHIKQLNEKLKKIRKITLESEGIS